MTETAGGAFLLAGEFLSFSSLEHKSIREGGEGEEELGPAAWQGEFVKALRESAHDWN